jgi:hypothetical protein
MIREAMSLQQKRSPVSLLGRILGRLQPKSKRNAARKWHQRFVRIQRQKKQKDKRRIDDAQGDTFKPRGPSECTRHLGYLATRPTNTPIPETCLPCLKLVDCMVTQESTKTLVEEVVETVLE